MGGKQTEAISLSMLLILPPCLHSVLVLVNVARKQSGPSPWTPSHLPIDGIIRTLCVH